MRALQSTILVVLMSFTVANVAQSASYEWRRSKNGGVRCYKVTPEGRPHALADDDECRRSQGSYYKWIHTKNASRCYEIAPNGGIIGFANTSLCP